MGVFPCTGELFLPPWKPQGHVDLAGLSSEDGKSKELLRRGFSLWSSRGSLEALADAVGRWRVTLPACWAHLAGWAVAEGVSRGPVPAPLPRGSVVRRGGGVPTPAPCRAGAPGPTMCLHWDPQQQTAMATQDSWCKNNTSGGVNKLFLCARGGHAELTQGLALRCHRGLIQTC